ncbi:unnamed protein product, partial [Prorocentrum cordatum]
GTSFAVVPAVLDSSRLAQYDASVELWRDVLQMLHMLMEQGYWPAKANSRVLSLFWSAQQRFFKGIIIGAKVPEVVRLTNEALGNGEAVVLSLWTTNEGPMNKAQDWKAPDEDQCNDGFLSGPELIMRNFIESQFPADRRFYGRFAWAVDQKASIHARIVELKLPPNPLDDLIDRLGGPQAVAEMSGRSHRRCRDAASGEVRVERRKSARAGPGGTVDSVNLGEQRAFQSGFTSSVSGILIDAERLFATAILDRRSNNEACFCQLDCQCEDRDSYIICHTASVIVVGQTFVLLDISMEADEGASLIVLDYVGNCLPQLRGKLYMLVGGACPSDDRIRREAQAAGL